MALQKKKTDIANAFTEKVNDSIQDKDIKPGNTLYKTVTDKNGMKRRVRIGNKDASITLRISADYKAKLDIYFQDKGTTLSTEIRKFLLRLMDENNLR